MFVTGLSQEEAERVELGFGPLWLATNKADAGQKVIESSVFGMHKKKAVYREGQGCVVMNKRIADEYLTTSIKIYDADYGAEIFPEKVITGNQSMQEAIMRVFDKEGSSLLQSRAVVVLQNGEIIGEAYASGIGTETPLLGWSMAKSITGLLAGVLHKNGYWNLDEPAPIVGWQNDERGQITLRQIMQMTTGLDWEEDYGKVSNATAMLYREENMGEYAASVSLAHKPGETWLYSSGTTNILANALSDAFSTSEAYINFPYASIFAPIGAKTFLLETDRSGHFVGSSYAYASARDWAKVGQLTLQHGRWMNEQIIDSTWIDFIRTPSQASAGQYGGQVWTNQSGKYSNLDPEDYWFDGFQGQQVAILQKEKMVVVRLGVTYDETDFDFNSWVLEIKNAAKEDSETNTVEIEGGIPKLNQ